MGVWFNKEINSISDFHDITMRIPGLGADILEEFGVKSDKKIWGKSLPIDQIKNYLQAGKLTAAEWIGPYDDMQLGLHEAAKYYYHPGWWEPGTTFDVQVNLDAWKKLPDKYQKIFKAACWQTHFDLLAMYEQKNSEAMQTILQLQKQDKLKIKEFNSEILQAVEQTTTEILEKYSVNPDFKDVYDEWKQFKKRIRTWSKYGLRPQ